VETETKKKDSSGRNNYTAKAGFAQPSKTDHKEVKCLKCYKKGHFARDCKEKPKKENESTKTDQTDKNEGGKKAAQFMQREAVTSR
jgi:hypothetical protein